MRVDDSCICLQVLGADGTGYEVVVRLKEEDDWPVYVACSGLLVCCDLLQEAA